MSVHVITTQAGEGARAVARITGTGDDLARRVCIQQEAAAVADAVHQITDPSAPSILAVSLARTVGQGRAQRAELVCLIGYLLAEVERLDKAAAR